MARQTRWDLALGVAGVVYLMLVLFMGVEVPVFGIVLVVFAAYALIRPHRTNSRPQRDAQGEDRNWPLMNADKRR